MKTLCIAFALALLPLAAAPQAIVNEPALSANAALEVANGALTHCRKEGQKVSVTVVDQAGRAKVSIRDDGAAPHTAEHSLRKAYTALTYKMPSGAYGKRAAERPGAIGPQLLANITTAAGGVPIRSGNTVIAAIGVSGTPGSAGGGEADEKCAEAGIDKIAKGLAGK